MKHYITPLARFVAVRPESALLTYSEIIVSDDEKTHHYDAPERQKGAWSYEWDDAFSTE